MSIQPAEPKDAFAIANLLDQLGYPTSEPEALQKIENHTKPSYKLFTAKRDDQVVGLIALHVYHQLHLPGPVGRITSFCVDEKVRGTGVGSALLKAAEEFFSEEGCFKIEVTSNLRRMQTHEYYLRHGYSETSKHFVKVIERH